MTLVGLNSNGAMSLLIVPESNSICNWVARADEFHARLIGPALRYRIVASPLLMGYASLRGFRCRTPCPYCTVDLIQHAVWYQQPDLSQVLVVLLQGEGGYFYG